MKISVVSPSLNQAAFLGRTIESVAVQDHADKEHIIIDGGSSDGSADLIRNAARRYPHITAVIESDRGQADAINKGFHLASGEILAWLNTDDYYSDPGVLSAIADFLSRHPDVDVAWGRGLRVDSDGKKITEAWLQPAGTDFTTALHHSLGLLQPSVFFRRSVVETVGGLSEEYPLQLDYEYWIRIAGAGFRFGFVDRLLSHATVHAGAKSTALRMQQLNECLRLVDESFDYVPIQWIQRFAEFFLTRQDRKVTKGLTLDDEQQVESRLIERALLAALNGNERARSTLRRGANSEPHATTWRAMEAHGLDQPRPRRVVITSFDPAYFRQGLNLIAALQRTSLSSFDELFVYALGLDDFQRARLSSIDKVTVRDYPEEARGFYREYLHPKTRAYKPCAIRSDEPHVRDGDLVLWMDAGLAPVQDVGQIFEIVADQEFFITDHDDKPGWPFFNINFAHPGSHAPLTLGNDDLLGLHLCSALLGYKRGGRYQHIIDEAYRLSQIREVTIWPKVIPASQKETPVLTPAQRALRDQLASGETPPEAVPYEELRRIFFYYGHRTQTVYSVLARRADAPVFSARTYRRSDDKSSKAAHINWSDTALATDSTSARVLDDGGFDERVVVYHHRGTYTNLDGLRHKRAGPALFVVGNGPSLRQFSFGNLKGRSWLGMNAAYRYWEEVGIYPTYYSCFDTVVLESHRIPIVGLIKDRAALGISKFFLRRSILEHHPELAQDPGVYFLEDLQSEHPDWFAEGRITTGSSSVLVGWFLGYRDIHLLGIDLNYVERLPEAQVEGRALKLAADPESNPNYFFDTYQRKGDRYNPPNRHPGMHQRSWAQLRAIAESFPMTITNLNRRSEVRDFPFEDFDAVLRRTESRDALPERIANQVVQQRREQQYWRERTILEHATGRDPLGTRVAELIVEERAMRDRINSGIRDLLTEQRAARRTLEVELEAGAPTAGAVDSESSLWLS